MLGTELQRSPTRLALEVRDVEPAAAIDTGLGVLLAGQIAIAGEQEVVESDIGKHLRVQGGAPSIRTDPYGQARTQRSLRMWKWEEVQSLLLDER